MIRYIYQTTNLVNGKIYIGVHETSKPYDRYLGSRTILKAAIKKYGRHNFEKTILEFFGTSKSAYAREAEIVDDEFINDPMTYNIKLGGKGGFKHTHNNGHAHHLMRCHKGGMSRKKQMEERGNPLVEYNRQRLLQCSVSAAVAHLVDIQEVAGSNPAQSTNLRWAFTNTSTV